ncbi:nucleotidyltransferase-like protein [Paenibacillus sp. MBLB4367]|uniref:nucleotidyltransferase-like protein n=1 Tax=Paenibacillus sp. MBLB4367 TaxID=3384767 RepID=UPI003907EE58
MDRFKTELIERLKMEVHVMSVLLYEYETAHGPMTDHFHRLVLIVYDRELCTDNLFHYIKDGSRIQERWLKADELESLVQGEENRNTMEWIVRGEILLDRRGELEHLRHRLLEFPDRLRERKMMAEFAAFLRTYSKAKDYLREDHVMDAYSCVMAALHHWARIVIIEHGSHPEMTVWEQVHRINPGVYKLYEELTSSMETLRQRVELVLLACEFSVMSKMESCCMPLLRALSSREEPWSSAELLAMPEFSDLQELTLLLNKLVKKSLVNEVAVALTDDFAELEIRYTK